MVAKKQATKKSKSKAKARASTKRGRGKGKGKPIAYDGTNFSKILPHFKGGPAVVINILVHLDGCGPCQRIMGPYKKAVSKAPSDAVNVSVESKMLDQLNDDIQKNVPGASTLTVPSYPHIIKVNNSGKITNATTPSPSNIKSLTSNTKSPNQGLGPVTPPTKESMNPLGSMTEENESDDMGKSMKELAASYKTLQDDEDEVMDMDMNEDEDEDSDSDEDEDEDMPSSYNTLPKAQSIMSGGSAYSILASAFSRKKTGRKTGRKTQRKSRRRT
jgi:hypothetical protein